MLEHNNYVIINKLIFNYTNISKIILKLPGEVAEGTVFRFELSEPCL